MGKPILAYKPDYSEDLKQEMIAKIKEALDGVDPHSTCVEFEPKVSRLYPAVAVFFRHEGTQYGIVKPFNMQDPAHIQKTVTYLTLKRDQLTGKKG